MTDYVNLHTHTTYSIMHSLLKPTELFKKVKELGQSAVAVTDSGTLAGAWDCYKYSKEAGVKLIMGCEFYFVDDVSVTEGRMRHIILLAKNYEGYKNLLLLNKLANDNFIVAFKKVFPRIDWKLLEAHHQGLICTTACSSGILGQLISNRKTDEAKRQAKRLKDIFGDDLGLEIQPNALRRQANAYHDYRDQVVVNSQLIRFGEELDIKIVPAIDIHYLTPDQHEAHDVLLAIGAGQPVKSRARLSYDNEFYLKSRQEVRDFFARLYKNKADVWCDNTLYFSSLCEEPDWIDPKFSNPSGKELPEFPVQDQKDYLEFKMWLEHQSGAIEIMPQDAAYLRYWCEKEFVKRVPVGREAEYRARLDEEYEVIEFHGFSSYMLIVADYIDYCRKNSIPVGPGRGCLTKETLVLTTNGFKYLPEININDNVYTHTGKIQKVINKFEYKVNERLLKITTDFSFNPITLTSDHKLYACKAELTEKYKKYFSIKNKFSKIRKFKKPVEPTWIKASELSVDDFIFMPFPKMENDELIYNQFPLTNESLYFLGRWIGDGWFYYHKKLGYQIGIAFHSEDVNGVARISSFLTKLGFNVKLDKHKTKKLIQLKIHDKKFQETMKEIFPDYKNKSLTKHLPIFFRKLSKDQIKLILQGLIESDGHIEIGKNQIVRENIDSTSQRLILEVKEALLFLGIPSSINTRNSFKHGKYICNKSFKLRFKGIFTPKSKNNSLELGYFCKIKKIESSYDDLVYDIHVENDTSYLTTNYAVHNSVGGSLIGWLMGIHQADPIKYNLIFARFHNKEKTSFPDIDSDFAPSGREQVQNYIRRKYGEDRVAHVSNVNTMTPKVYARDIARTFEFGGDRKAAVAIGTAIADSIPAEIKTIEEALEKAPLFSEFANSKYSQLRKFAEPLGAKAKAWSTHAGGLVIGKRPLADFIPLRRDKEGNIAIEYEKERAESNGLVKMDTLGLETLDIIKQTYELITLSNKPLPPEILDYDEYDFETYNLLAKGDTLCVFQLGESGGTIDLCRKVKPKSIEDISLINALARPSARDIREDFVAARNGTKPIELLHPSLQRAFGPTYGFGLFEECLMYLAQDVAGWDLHDSDRLRKLTKEKGKNPKKVASWKKEFVDDAVMKKGIPANIATQIWEEVVDKFQGYGFNVSHSTLYSMISYHTAYLKAHYPIEFLTANLISEVKSNAKKSADNILRVKDEIRKFNVKILPPDINRSEMTYKIIDEKTLLTGLDALKFIGKNAIPEILSKRPFTSFEDFLSKVEGRKVTSKSVQALAASGCLDSFGMTRKEMFLYAADYKKKLQVWLKKNRDTGKTFNYPWPGDPQDWTMTERYAMEIFYIGEGLSGNLREAYPGFFDNRASNFSKLSILYPEADMDKDDKILVGGIAGVIEGVVKSYFEFKVKKEGSKIFGETMAKAILEDPFGNTVGLTIFPKKLKELNGKLKSLKGIKLEPGIALHCAGFVNWYEGVISIIYEDLMNCAGQPSQPSDLKAKKVSMKITGGTRKKTKEIPNMEEFLEELEDELTEEGLAELEEEEEVETGEDMPDGFI